MSTRYQALLVSPDGEDYVTDHEYDTVNEVWDAVNDQGSKWFFYPLPFVVRYNGGPVENSQRIISAPDPFKHLEGRTLLTALEWIQENQDVVKLVFA